MFRAYAGRIGLEENFTIQDRGDAEDVMAMVRNDLGLAATKNRYPQKGTCMSIYSRVVNTQGSLTEVLLHAFTLGGRTAQAVRGLCADQAGAERAGLRRLLLFWSEMMGEPTLAAELGARFDHVLVHEYQDTNRLQAAIVLGLRPNGTGVTMVGDYAQSIYAFRGATVRNILDFPHQFGLPARTVALERNYRSTQPILTVSNAVIAQASDATPRHCGPISPHRRFQASELDERDACLG